MIIVFCIIFNAKAAHAIIPECPDENIINQIASTVIFMPENADIQKISSEKEIIHAGEEFTYNGVTIRWFVNEGFMFKYNSTVIYVDPIVIPPSAETADYIIVTHDHLPHYSPGDIAQLSDEETVVITSPQTPSYDVTVKPNDTLTYDSVSFEFVPMYNVNKFRPESGEPYHPKELNGVGVILDFGVAKIYHAADTDRIPEMTSIVTDIALLPVTGGAWMTTAEAAGAVEDLKISSDLKYAIPMHYGYNGITYVGSEANALNFSQLANCSVVILDNLEDWLPHVVSEPEMKYPTGGEILSGIVSTQWNESTDSWGHPVEYTVFYSADSGSTWNVLESSRYSTISAGYEWNTTALEDGSKYKFKVFVSCSVNLYVSTEAITNNSFTINNTITTTSDTSNMATSPGLTLGILFLTATAVVVIERVKRRIKTR